MFKANNDSAISRQQLVDRLSHNGKFTVKFVNHPEHPEVLEYISPPSSTGRRTRYVNLGADEGANVSRLLTE